MTSRRTDYPKIRPVIVRWIDSMGSSGWNATPDARMEVVTVGTLIERDKRRVAVALSRSHYSHGDILEIPICAVRSVKRLKE